MSKIISIGTAVPAYKHQQDHILDFMQRVYAPDEAQRRKLKFLYRQGGINSRYSVIPDYSLPAAEWEFYSPSENLEPFPSLEKRMEWFHKNAALLSMDAIQQCFAAIPPQTITHLITVSCTGLSAPGLDIELMECLQLPSTIHRTSINFMGCYAAIHAMKMADAYCKADPHANVLIVCTELCTLHFQREATTDNITSSMLFADGAAAMLVSNDKEQQGLTIDHFYSTVMTKGKPDMAWSLSSTGFQMVLSGYIADLIGEDFKSLVDSALSAKDLTQDEITHWCIHPGGKKILEAVHTSLGFTNGQLQPCYDILREYGNMSSCTVLFVLQRIMQSISMVRGDTNHGEGASAPLSTNQTQNNRIFGAAFGPGLTMETFILSQ